jgi:hypothetical protein
MSYLTNEWDLKQQPYASAFWVLKWFYHKVYLNSLTELFIQISFPGHDGTGHWLKCTSVVTATPSETWMLLS